MGKAGSALMDVLASKSEYLDQLLRRRLFKGSLRQGHEMTLKQEDFDIEGEKLRIHLTARSVFYNKEEIKKLAGGDAQAALAIELYLQTFNPDALNAKCAKGKTMTVNHESKDYVVKH